MFRFMLAQIYFKLRVLFCGENILAGATQKWGHDKLMGVTLLAIDPFQVGIAWSPGQLRCLLRVQSPRTCLRGESLSVSTASEERSK